MPWDLSCPDWQARVREGRSLVPALPLFQEEARRAVGVFNKFRLPDVEGKPLLAEAAGDWFRDIVRALFGSFDPVTRERLIREFFILVAKKNNKTTGGAAVMMTALVLNKRPRAEFLLIGPTKIVADTAFNQAVGMVEADDEGYLQKRFHPRDHVREIVDRKTKAVLKIKTFDTGVLTGVKPAGVLIDELHEIAAMHDADRVIGQLRGGLIPNPEAFLVFITTQSERPPAGVFLAELMKARKIRDGALRTVSMLPVLYEFPDDMQRGGEDAAWRDPANWWMVTPNRGKSVTIDRLISDFEGERAMGEAAIRRWASQHLNVEIGLGLLSDAWVGAHFWDRGAERGLTLQDILDRCEVIACGVDGGGLDDLFGLAFIGREIGTGRWLLWTHAWVHVSQLDRRKSEAARLLDFERDGDLTIVRTLGDDIADITATIEMVEASGKLCGIGLDPVGIGAVVEALSEIGIEEERRIGISQGWKLAGAIKTMERKLADGTLIHAEQPLMAWCVGNAKVEPRGNAIMITKAVAGSGKIDALMAAFDAVHLMSQNPESPGSIYATPERPFGLLAV